MRNYQTDAEITLVFIIYSRNHNRQTSRNKGKLLCFGIAAQPDFCLTRIEFYLSNLFETLSLRTLVKNGTVFNMVLIILCLVVFHFLICYFENDNNHKNSSARVKTEANATI